MAPAEVPAGLRLPRSSVCPESRHLAQERESALHAAIARIPTRCMGLLGALLDDPAADYWTLAVRLGIPRGSIGPTRSSCLECLRRSTRTSDDVVRDS